MKLNKKSLYIILSVILCSVAMSVVDAIIQPTYLIKSAIKIILFLIVPFTYFLFNKQEFQKIKKLFTPNKKGILTAFLLGVGVFSVILIAYFLFKNLIDFSGIANQLTSSAGVSANNFVFVAIYISIINSLLEEFFFRGFAFITLKNLTSRPFAYIFSSALFAFYHFGMTATWFNIGIFILAVLGLFVGGCIFNFLNEKQENIYNSWLVHFFANLAINTIGFIIFGII